MGWGVVTEPDAAVKVVLLEPAGTVTETGTVIAAPDELSVTANPLPDAGLDSVTVQVEDAPDTTVDGEQASEDIRTGATRVSAAVPEVPFRDAFN